MVERALNALIDVAFYGFQLVLLGLLIYLAQAVGWYWLAWVFIFILALVLWDMYRALTSHITFTLAQIADRGLLGEVLCHVLVDPHRRLAARLIELVIGLLSVPIKKF